MTPNQFLELATSISVQVALVVLVASGLSRLVNESGQCRLWTVCHAVILSLLAVALVFPHFRWLQPWSYLSSSRTAELVAVEAPLGRLLLLVWLIGCAASVAVFVFRNVQAARFLRTCRPIPGSERLLPVESGAGSPSKKDNTGRNQNCGTLMFWRRWPQPERSMDVMLLTSSRLAAPFCWQFHRPYIVVPEFIVKDDPEALQFVVRHEWEHLRTGHPLQLFLQRIVETLFWYHPMVWWAARQSDVVREFLCDDAAIESPKQISRYLRALLRIIERGTAGHTGLVAALPFTRSGGTIARRARRLAAIA